MPRASGASGAMAPRALPARVRQLTLRITADPLSADAIAAAGQLASLASAGGTAGALGAPDTAAAAARGLAAAGYAMAVATARAFHSEAPERVAARCLWDADEIESDEVLHRRRRPAG